MSFILAGGKHAPKKIVMKTKIDFKAEHDVRLLTSSLEAASDALYWMTPQGSIVNVNKAACNMLGFTREEMLQLSVPELDVLYDAEKWKLHFEELRKIGSLKFESIHKTKDGRVIPVEIVANYIRFEDEEFNCAFVRDITQRKLSEQALHESELRFKNILQDVKTIAVQGYSQDGTTTYWNRASEILYGFSAQEAIGKNLLDLIIPSEMRDEVQEAMKWMAETQQAIPSSELLLQRKDGSRVSVFSHHTLVSVSGKPTELFCLDIDQTDRKVAEEKLKVSEQLYRNLFNQANEGLILLTMDGKIAELNQSFALMHGYTVEEMKNMDIKDLDVLREDAFEGRAEVIRRIHSGEVVRFEVEHFHKDGHSFFLSDTVSLISIANQQYYLAFHQDITERKHAEQEIQKRINELERFQKLVVGRELRMIELKKEINELLKRLGEEKRYA